MAKTFWNHNKGRKIKFNPNSIHYGKAHPRWKGDKASYLAKHLWVYRQGGKATHCQNVDCVYPRKNAARSWVRAPKAFNWANISGKYKREMSDWMQLCVSCHKKYDMGIITITT